MAKEKSSISLTLRFLNEANDYRSLYIISHRLCLGISQLDRIGGEAYAEERHGLRGNHARESTDAFQAQPLPLEIEETNDNGWEDGWEDDEDEDVKKAEKEGGKAIVFVALWPKLAHIVLITTRGQLIGGARDTLGEFKWLAIIPWPRPLRR
ncbi:hypothetical protein HZH66_012367 [Vespula vulgaris]|uniref:Uncharacterized protein n=1 Tax=Vespula vulgaris TaxID=7454 RepID=A0A834JBE9_VESVU|nr:hypothetical protein HZH66_012367 [Vespula vulgaris]